MSSEDISQTNETPEIPVETEEKPIEAEEVKEETNNSAESNESAELTEIESKIVKQIEYYFGDYNLRTDKFLKEQVKLNDGWIPLETLTKFNRLKSLSTDFQQIATALKKSPNKLMEVNSDVTKIRRNPDKPIAEHGSYEEEKLRERCVYVKKFPDGITLDELQEFFKGYGTPENVLMRRFYHSKQFKGSVFVTFSTKEEADKFIDLPSVKYNNNELCRESRISYGNRKEVEHSKYREEKEKKLKEKEAIQSEMAKEKIMRGCLLKLTGVTNELNWEKLKTFFNSFASVAFVDFSKNKSEAILRFTNEGDAKLALESAIEANEEKKLIVSNVELSGSVVEGEEEENYWTAFKQQKSERYSRNIRKGKKGKRGRYNDRNRDENSDASSQKKFKRNVEST